MITRVSSLLVVVSVTGLAGCSGYVPGDAAHNLGHPVEAREIYESKYKAGSQAAGLRLAEMYAAGMGGAADPKKAVAVYEELAAQGVVAAEHNLGYCHEYGLGIPVDYQQAAIWYEKAAHHRYVPAIYNLGTLYANERLMPKNDVEGLTLLLEAAELGKGRPDEKARFICEDPPGHRHRLIARMSPTEVSLARKQAGERTKEFRQRPEAANGLEDVGKVK